MAATGPRWAAAVLLPKMLMPVSWLALATAAAPKTCYWFEGYDARGVNNTSWDGPVRTPLPPHPSQQQPLAAG